MRLVLDEPKSIETLRKIYNDSVTFITSTKSYPFVSEIEFKGDYQSTLRKRQVPAKVGKRVDREITKYEKKLTKIWDYYQTRINRIIRFEDIGLIREILRSKKDVVEKQELTLARVLRERNPRRRFILRQKFLQQNKARLIQSQLDEMAGELQRVSRPAFRTVFKLGKMRGQLQSDQELDDRLTIKDRRLLSEKDEWNSQFVNKLADDSWNHYEVLLAIKFDEPSELIDALEGLDKKERHRLPLFAAAIASVLLAAGTARAARDVTTDPKTGEEKEEAVLDEETGIPIGVAYKGGTWHTRHDNRVCPGCEGNDGQWMTNDEFQAEAGTNECLTRCRCVELFELAEKPVNKNKVWRGKPGASIKDWPRFKKSNSILRKLYPALLELQGILIKHLPGQHDQQRHDPTRGRSGVKTQDLTHYKGNVVYWHGSPLGDLPPIDKLGIHIGTRKAAKIALEASIGIPASGEWDGVREYGKTLLAGTKRMEEENLRVTGFNTDAPENDYYPPGTATYGSGETIALTVKPNIFPVIVSGKMTNSPSDPHSDIKANAIMSGQIRRGKPKRGYYYRNEGEDFGSISVVVPNAIHLERVPLQEKVEKHTPGGQQHDQSTHGRRTGVDPKRPRTLFSNLVASEVAARYVTRAGLAPIKSHTTVKVDKERGGQIAAAYDSMKNEPNSPRVKAAYKAMADEVKAQYKMLPVKVEYTKDDPYNDSESMMRDVLDNKRLKIFTGGKPHPLLGAKGFDGVTVNDNFRAVHDYFGHAMRGHQFGPSGEENAWIEHSKMFTPLAQRAMTTETRGQNSWFNFSRENIGKPAKERKFAEQKVGILPDEFLPKRARRKN